MTRRLALALTSFILIGFAVTGPLDAREPRQHQYLPVGSVDGATLLSPPPARDSVAYKEQMAIVFWLQRTRTPAQIAFVQKELNLERFAPLLSDALVGVDGIELKEVLDAVIAEVRVDYDAVKAIYDEPRPFQVNDVVQPVTEPRPVAAYPSGHAIRSIVYARLLAEIFPDKTDALIELAQQIGYGRVIAGVHYPADVLAGQKLGNAYADVIVNQAAFKEAVERIRGRRPPSRGNAGSP